nr:sensor histidine kinase [uncultured Carboxylicivirga sp.]
MFKFRVKHIRTNLAITIGAFVFVTILVLGWVQYYSVSQSIMDDAYTNRLITTLRSHQSSIQSLLEKAIETSEILADDPSLTNWFTSSDNNDHIKQIALERLSKLHNDFGYYTVFAVNIKNHEYWRENNNLLDVISENDPDDSWFFETIKKKHKSTLNFDFNKELKETILFVNVIMGDIENPIGIAGVGIDPSMLVEEFNKTKTSQNTRLWLIDDEGKIIMSEDTKEINYSLNTIIDNISLDAIINSSYSSYIQHLKIKNERYELASLVVGNTNYRMVMMIPQKELLSILDIIRLNTIWLSLIILALTLILVTFVSNRITNPLIRLSSFANKLWDNQLHIKIDPDLIDRKDEIGHLAHSFESMQQQLTEVIDRLNKTNKKLNIEQSQLRNTNQQLEQALEKVSESERLTKSFLANISHEVRTPMNSIMGFGQLLEVEDLGSTVLNSYANIIVRNSQQLLSILNNLIEVSKMDSGMTKPHLISISAKQLVSDIYDLFTYASSKETTIINQSTGITEDIVFESDQLLIRQVLNNLLSNAIKYTRAGTITIGFKTNKESIVFYVSDTGIGISEEDIKSIFEPFWQVDQTTTINEGAGLGLAISKRIADILNGQLWAESKPNKGSTFYVSLPL